MEVTHKQHNCFRASNLHIRSISEESCDTEDWSNDAENTALNHRNKFYFKINNLKNNSNLTYLLIYLLIWKIFISNKLCSFEVYLSKNSEK